MSLEEIQGSLKAIIRSLENHSKIFEQHDARFKSCEDRIDSIVRSVKEIRSELGKDSHESSSVSVLNPTFETDEDVETGSSSKGEI